jgi:hypothetical protein
MCYRCNRLLAAGRQNLGSVSISLSLSHYVCYSRNVKSGTKKWFPPPQTQTVFRGYCPSRPGLIAKNRKKYEITAEKQSTANKIRKTEIINE